MAIVFDPVTGLLDTAEYPDQPASSTAARQQFMDLFYQLRDFLNGRHLMRYDDAGTADALVITPSNEPSSLTAGDMYIVKKGANANTGACTLKVGALAAKSMKINGADPAAGALAGAAHIIFIYDGTNFQAIMAPIYRPGGTDVPVADGGTGLSTVALGSVLAANVANTVVAITSAAGLRVLVNNAGAISWETVTGTGSPAMADSPVFTTKITTPQVAFPAVQAPSADANTLDDYEEGAWTPGISFGGAAVNITYSAQNGTYTKIGNRVTVTGYIVLSNKGSSTGLARITGLPFTCRNNAGDYSAASLYLEEVTFANVFMGYVEINATTIRLVETTEAGTVTNLADTNFVNYSTLMVTAIYEVA